MTVDISPASPHDAIAVRRTVHVDSDSGASVHVASVDAKAETLGIAPSDSHKEFASVNSVPAPAKAGKFAGVSIRAITVLEVFAGSAKLTKTYIDQVLRVWPSITRATSMCPRQ